MKSSIKISEEWEELSLSEAIEVSPKRELKKGTQAKFISMADLKEFNKKIQGFITKEFAGGSKFINEDTLMARITPCLENGKTAFVDILEKQEIGSGSTEFIVLAAKENKTIPEFVYYLAMSPEIRAQAIQSMTGSSGRQRVESDVFDKILVNIPGIPEQHVIAKILSDLDEKIKLNHQINKTLESISQAIFKKWFVDLEFPEYEKTKFVNGLPEGWRNGALGEIVSIESGKRPGEKSETKTQDFTVPLMGASSIMGFVKDALYNEPILIIGRVGTHGIVQRISSPSFPSDNTLVIRSKYFEFVYQILKTIDYEALNIGTTQPLITQTTIKKYSILIPNNEVLRQFEVYISGLFKKVVENNRESEFLAEIRDSILPRLMSGKIRMQNSL